MSGERHRYLRPVGLSETSVPARAWPTDLLSGHRRPGTLSGDHEPTATSRKADRLESGNGPLTWEQRTRKHIGGLAIRVYYR